MKLLIPLIFLLASCGASHKLKQSQQRTADSTATVSRDTDHVTREVNHSSNIEVQDVHVKISYKPLDSAMAAYIRSLYTQWPVSSGDSEQTSSAGSIAREQNIAGKASPGTKTTTAPASAITDIARAVQKAISATSLPGQIPAEVEIDIGRINSGTTFNEKVDSTAGHDAAQTDLHTTEESKSKEVAHEGMPGLVQMSLWLLLILAIIGIICTWLKKPVIIKNIIKKLLNI
ncbi:MAG: hypothetical protein BGO55_00525 [Sphingobacteriales bacterium 50-39]|nr:hypothetical protein [Sphingobacteriales bacterium]OJW53599.1 MAG: hypothetical protein BGO55_00525 [Sphingobacteriales bacterium 50-39]